MLTEIDKDFYCSGGFFGGTEWCNNKNIICYRVCGDNKSYCPCLHRKYPTPEQYKEEYGEQYPDDWAVYVDVDYILADENGYPLRKYSVHSYRKYKTMMEEQNAGEPISNPYMKIYSVYCACTPFGKPPQDWRP